MKLNRMLSIFMAGAMVFSLAACGDKDDTKANGDVSGAEIVADASQEQALTNQMIDKPNLGITMELTGDYANCLVEDLELDRQNAILEGGIGGFRIVKDYGDERFTITEVVVALTSVLDAKGHNFPYEYSGNKYSVVAINPMIDSTSEHYEEVMALQSNCLSSQLTTMFLDEQSIDGGNTEAGTVVTDEPQVFEDVTPEQITDIEQSQGGAVDESNENIENSNTESEVANEVSDNVEIEAAEETNG